MYLVKNKRNAYLSLIFFSFLTTITWWIELGLLDYEKYNYYSWLGRKLHYTIPISLFYFVLWINLFFKLGAFKLKINTYLLFWIVLGTLLFIEILKDAFMRSYNGLYWNFPNFIHTPMVILLLIIFLFFPLIVFYSLQLFKINIPIRYRLLSFILFWVGPPILTELFGVYNNYSHNIATKLILSGYFFPFFFFLFGFPLIYSQKGNIRLKEKERIDILDDFS